MQELILLAGPNGAGKSSFANTYLPATEESLIFVNADEFARELGHLDLPKPQLDLRAGREMLEYINLLVEQRTELMIETTLATLTYAQKVPIWQQMGYTISLIYLRLPSVEASIDRVQRRVKDGGHGIPEATIRKRYHRRLDYLENLYKPIVDEWYIWDSLEGDFRLAEAWDDA